MVPLDQHLRMIVLSFFKFKNSLRSTIQIYFMALNFTSQDQLAWPSMKIFKNIFVSEYVDDRLTLFTCIFNSPNNLLWGSKLLSQKLLKSQSPSNMYIILLKNYLVFSAPILSTTAICLYFLNYYGGYLSEKSSGIK